MTETKTWKDWLIWFLLFIGVNIVCILIDLYMDIRLDMIAMGFIIAHLVRHHWEDIP